MQHHLQKAGEALEHLKSKHPLVHCLTNGVVKNFTANALLATGAAPAMVEDPVEANEFARVADGLLVNLGTLDASQIESMKAAVTAANEASTPWILDPVAIGLLSTRTSFAKVLLERRPAIIRGNASEIIALSGQSSQGRGTDSRDSADAALGAAFALAEKTGGAILVTGPVDYVIQGKQKVSIANGHANLTRVTGIGCAQGAIAAAFAACAQSPFEAAIAAALTVAIAGDIAAETTKGIGSFQIAFLDALDGLTPAILVERAKLQ